MLFLCCVIFHSPLSPPSLPHLLSSLSFFPHSFIPRHPSCFPLFSSEHWPEASLLLSNSITPHTLFHSQLISSAAFKSAWVKGALKEHEGASFFSSYPGHAHPSALDYSVNSGKLNENNSKAELIHRIHCNC